MNTNTKPLCYELLASLTREQREAIRRTLTLKQREKFDAVIARIDRLKPS